MEARRLAVLLCFLSIVCICYAIDLRKNTREPIVLIPGFASSRLMSWKFKSCGAGFNINIGDRVWLDVAHVLYDTFRESCWSDCMMLEPTNQTDPEDCKLRAVSSIEAISELDPGQITGPLSSIFRGIIDLLTNNYEYDTTNLAAVPYDWRLPPQVLEDRDRYFSSLKNTVESLVEFNKKPAVVIAHSMGNNIFLHFTEWIKLQHPNDWQKWFDSYISTFFAIGAPLLGSPQVVRTAMSGQTFGLPISETAVRNFMVTFGSGPWMFPVPDPSPVTPHRSTAGWPFHPVTIEYWNTAEHRTVNYTVESVIDGSLWKEASEYDEQTTAMAWILDKYYKNATLNPLERAPPRPPINNVYCVYGINAPTELGYQYRVIDNSFRLKKTIWEDSGGEIYSTTALLKRKKNIAMSEWGKSGDGTITYNSLSWGQTWHHGDVNVTHIPTVVDTSSRVQGLLELLGMEKLIYGKTRYDSAAVVDGRELKTTVIEIEKLTHRDIIRSQSFLDLLEEELDPRTNIPYIPFKSTNPNFKLKDLSSRTLEQLFEELTKELEIRKSEPAQENSEPGEIQEPIPIKDVRITKKDPFESEKLMGEINDDRIVCNNPFEDREVDGWLVGNNTEHDAEEVEFPRDDDEGSEFRTKAQGGIL